MFRLLLKKNTLALLIIVVATVGLYWVLFLNIKWVQEDMSLLLNQVESDLKRDETFRSIELILKDAQADLASIESHFVSSDGVVGFIDSLEDIAKKSGVTLIIDFLGVEDGVSSPEAEKDIKETLRLRLTTDGGWEGTMRFLAFIETMPFPIILERTSVVYVPESENALSFTPPKGVPIPKASWRGSFDFTVFKLKEYVQKSS